MTTQTNAWALTQDEATWVSRATSDSHGVDKIAFRMIPGIGPDVSAVTMKDGSVLTPTRTDTWGDAAAAGVAQVA